MNQEKNVGLWLYVGVRCGAFIEKNDEENGSDFKLARRCLKYCGNRNS
jgi:hypothetical protein